MRKKILVLLCFILTGYVLSALEIVVPHFDLGLSFGRKADNAGIGITQETNVNLRLLQGDRFYSDLDIGLFGPNIMSIRSAAPEDRTIGNFIFCNFSLNWLNMGGKPLSFGIFTGKHNSLTGMQYMEEQLKTDIEPLRIRETGTGKRLIPLYGIEGIGISLGGRITNASYIGTSFAWNGRIKEAQEYGLYMQGGVFSPTVISNTFTALHITDKARKILLSGSSALLFPITPSFSLYMEAGLDKTDVRSKQIKYELLHSINFFLEPRFRFELIDFDITVFASALRKPSHTFFPAAALYDPYQNVTNDLYTGLNIYSGFGDIELNGLKGGVHVLTGLNTEKIKDKNTLLLTITPFFSTGFGSFVLTAQVQLLPLAIKTPQSMFEGNIVLKREL